MKKQITMKKKLGLCKITVKNLENHLDELGRDAQREVRGGDDIENLNTLTPVFCKP